MKMKKIVMLSVLCGAALSVCAQDVSGEKSVDPNVLNTIAYINQMNYAYVVMKTYHNPIAIQEQYERIELGKIDITSIPNHKHEGKSMKELILDMQDKLRALAIAEEDYDYYKECQEDAYRERKKKFWFEFCATPFEALADAGHVLKKGTGKADGYTVSFQAVATLAGRLIGGPVKTISAYQNELAEMRKKNKEHEFYYDRTKENAVHQANKDLLSAEFDFVNQLGLKRSDVVTPNELQELMDVLKSGEQSHVYPVLNRPEMRRRFDVFAPYWYYLSLSAFNTANYDVAIEAAEMFFKRHRSLMKVDPMVAQAAVVQASAILGLKGGDNAKFDADDKKKLGEILDKICDVNYSQANSDQSYFCANVLYRYLDRADDALKVIEASVARLEERFGQRLMDYRNKYKGVDEDEDGNWREIPSDVDLLRARALYGEILQGKKSGDFEAKMMAIIKGQTTSSLEKFFYVGQVRADDLWKEARKDVLGIGLWYFDFTWKKNRFYVEIPVSWFILGEVKPTLSLMHGTNLVVRLDENFSERKLMRNKSGIGPSNVSMAFRCKYSLAGVDSVVLDFPHKNWPIKIVYRPTFDFDMTEGEGSNGVTYRPAKAFFMGMEKDVSDSVDSPVKQIEEQKQEDFSGKVFPFGAGAIEYLTDNVTGLFIDTNRTFSVAYTNPSPKKVSAELDVRYFTPFGAQLYRHEIDERIQPGASGEWTIKWPEELNDVEPPAYLQFQYRVD